MSPEPSVPPIVLARRPWLHALALTSAVLTFPLLLSGGSVTVYRVGMAVPDWPTTFGVNMFLYDMLNSSWGVQLEHSHRLIGSVLGLAALLLAVVAAFCRLSVRSAFLQTLLAIGAAIAFSMVPSRFIPAGVRPGLAGLAALGIAATALAGWAWFARHDRILALAWLALASVVGQGVLGGIRVLLVSTNLAFLHGCTAELVFGLLVAMCVVTGLHWSSPRASHPDDSRLRRRSLVTLAMVYTQLIMGAWVRHYADSRAVLLHALFATAVWGHCLAVGFRVLRNRERLSRLSPPAVGLIVFSSLQIVLGIVAWWLLRPFDGVPREVWPVQAAVRILHHALGALLLAASIVLTLRSYHLLESVPSPGRDPLSAPELLEVAA